MIWFNNGEPTTIIDKNYRGIIDERYLIKAPLGEGGMGIVFEAEEIELQRSLALKVMLPAIFEDQRSFLRFQREGKVLSGLSHKHILTFYHFGFHKDQNPYIAMELVTGKNLASVLSAEKTLSPERAIDIACQICDALSYLHENDVVHRDLKPANIMLMEHPHPDFVKLLDFGLAKCISKDGVISQKLTQTGVFIGSINYMSPEQARGQKSDARSDIYSLGCVLYEMLASEPPFSAENPAMLLQKHLNEPVRSLSQSNKNLKLPDGLEAVIFKCMEKEMAERYQSAAELKADLTDVKEGRGYGLNVSLKKRSSSSTHALIYSVGVFLIFCTIVLFVLNQTPPGKIQVDLLLFKYQKDAACDRLINDAQQLQSEGKGDDAIHLLEQALQVDSSTYSTTTWLRLSLGLAEIHNTAGHERPARKYAEKVLTRVEQLARTGQDISAEDSAIALKASEILLNMNIKPPLSRTVLDAVVALGIYAEKKHTDLFLSLTKLIVKESAAQGSLVTAMTHVKRLAYYHYVHGKNAVAEKYYLDALRYIKSHPFPQVYEEASTYVYLCNLYLQCGNGYKALESLKKGEELLARYENTNPYDLTKYDQDHHKFELMQLNYDFADLNARLGRTAASIAHLRKFLSNPEDNVFNWHVARVSLASNLLKSGQPKEAQKILDEQIKHERAVLDKKPPVDADAELLRDPYQQLASSYLARAELQKNQGQVKSARQDAQAAFAVMLEDPRRFQKSKSTWLSHALQFLHSSYLGMSEEEIQSYFQKMLASTLDRKQEESLCLPVELVLSQSYLRDGFSRQSPEKLKLAGDILSKFSSADLFTVALNLRYQGESLNRTFAFASAKLRFQSAAFIYELLGDRILKDLRNNKDPGFEQYGVLCSELVYLKGPAYSSKYIKEALPLCKSAALRWLSYYYLDRCYESENNIAEAMEMLKNAFEVRDSAPAEIALNQHQSTVIDYAENCYLLNRSSDAVPVLLRFLEESKKFPNASENEREYYCLKARMWLCIFHKMEKSSQDEKRNLALIFTSLEKPSKGELRPELEAANCIGKLLEFGVPVPKNDLLKARSIMQRLHQDRTTLSLLESMELARSLAVVCSSLKDYDGATDVCRKELSSVKILPPLILRNQLMSLAGLEQELGIDLTLSGRKQEGDAMLNAAIKRVRELYRDCSLPPDKAQRSFLSLPKLRLTL